MTAVSLAQSLIHQARERLELLPFAMERKAWNIVVREAQECVELALRGLLRTCGIEPPKIHDVGSLLLIHRTKLEVPGGALDPERLAKISKGLRKDRELSFYGEVDFIPTESYTDEQARQALADATFSVEQAESALVRNS